MAVPTTRIEIDSNCTLVAGFDAFGNRIEPAENTLVIAEIDRQNEVRNRMPPENVVRSGYYGMHGFFWRQIRIGAG